MTDLDLMHLMPYLALLGLILVIGLIGYWSQKAQQKAWADLATRTGLDYMPGLFFFSPPLVSGDYRNYPLVLDTFTRRHGKSSITYTRIVVSLNSQPDLRLEIYDEGVFSKIGKAVGMQDIQAGDNELDRRFIIKGQPENLIAGILTNINVRDGLLQTKSLHIELQGRTLCFQKTGIELDVEYLRALFDLMIDLAHAIERATGTPSPPATPFERAW